jgi:D-alanine-D-alanine ligase
MDRLSVGVIFGGRSVEHDVSIVTAHQVMETLSGRHELVPVYITREGRWLTGERLNDLSVHRAGRAHEVAEEGFIPPIAGYGGLMLPGGRLKGVRRIPLDVVIPSIHGTFGEDGSLQGLLDLAAIPYTGSGVVGSAVGMDKVAMKAAFRAAGLPVIPHAALDAQRYEADPRAALDEIESVIGYPAFVKPVRLGSSVGIGKARDRSALESAIAVASRYDRRILVETAMEGCIEVNCSVLGGPGREPRVSLCEQPVPWEEFLSFSDKYMRGGKSAADKGSSDAGMASQERLIPAPISDELTKQVQDNAVRAFTAVGAAGVARIDSFVREETGETWVMEINTIPGSFSFYLWEPSGLGFPELLDELVSVAKDVHRINSELMFTFESGILDSARGAKAGHSG